MSKIDDPAAHDDCRDVAEYGALRQEVIERIKLRQQIVSATLVLSAALLAVGVDQPIVPLLYPPFAAFLALSWAQNDYRVRDLSRYIQDHFECNEKRFGWESNMSRLREKNGISGFRVIVAAHGGLFLITQMGAIGLGITQEDLVFGPPWVANSFPWISKASIVAGLLAVDVASVVVVIWVIRQAKR